MVKILGMLELGEHIFTWEGPEFGVGQKEDCYGLNCVPQVKYV